MPVTNPFTITFDSFAVGGSSSGYQLNGPYVFTKSHELLRLSFDVVVVATSYADLRTKSDAVQEAFSKRLTNGATLVISLDGNAWTYTMGTTMLLCKAEVVKGGNQEIDRGYSRVYTVQIDAQLPATASSSLREIEVLVETAANGQRTVTMRGIYTASASGSAVANYNSLFPGEAALYLTAIDPVATWEMVTENATYDREKASGVPRSHTCPFTRQYVELLADQVQGLRNDPAIRDHRITFTDQAQFSGDGEENIVRLRRVSGTYECAVDRAVSTDLKTVYESKIKDHIKLLFEANYTPTVYGVEDVRVGYDLTGNRINVQFTFVYQPPSASQTVQVELSVAYRETRNIDYTPVHNGQEMAAIADVGFTVMERIWNRSAIVLERVAQPNSRIVASSMGGSTARTSMARSTTMPNIGSVPSPDRSTTGRWANFPDTGNFEAGWTVVSSISEIRPMYMGDPAFGVQIRATHATDTVTERYHSDPESGAGDWPFPGHGTGLGGTGNPN